MIMRNLFIFRLIRVARLDTGIYAEIKDDPAATWQAAGVVTAVALAHALEGVFLASRGGWNVLRSIIPGFQSEIIIWLVTATMMYGIGRFLFRSPISYRAIIRILGFASLPGILYALGFISEIILMISWVWRIVTIFIASRQVFGLGSVKSLAFVVVSGFVGFLATGFTTLLTLQILGQFGVR